MNTNDKTKSERLRLEKIESAYRKFSKILIGEVRKHFHVDQHFAEDVVHTTFERVLKYGHHFESYDDSTAFRFLYTITKHEAFRILRQKDQDLHRYSVDEILYEISNSTIENRNNPELLYVERTLIHESIRKLPPDYASVLYLHYYYGYKFKEIAAFLGISENAAIQKNYYIRRKLKEILAKEGFPDETNQ